MSKIYTARVETPMRPVQKSTREIILYIIFGGLTTLVNLISFYFFDIVFHSSGNHVTQLGFSMDPLDGLNITVSWIIAVLFAFITNRIFVFRSKGSMIRELVGFFASRIATLIVFEVGLFFLGISILENFLAYDKEDTFFAFGGLSVKYKLAVKLMVAVFVVIGNYVLSKIFVFNKNESKAKKDNNSSDAKDEECEKYIGK